MHDEKLGYYALTETPNSKGYIGSLLVVDKKGKPEEFRVTYPVRPTMIQRQLYGDSLLPHIGIELCGYPLFRALDNKPDILFVDDPAFLNLESDISASVIYAVPENTSAHLVDEGDTTAIVRSPTGLYDPIAIRYPNTYTQPQHEQIERVLERLFLGLNLIEPFQRIDAALAALQANNEKFR